MSYFNTGVLSIKNFFSILKWHKILLILEKSCFNIWVSETSHRSIEILENSFDVRISVSASNSKIVFDHQINPTFISSNQPKIYEFNGFKIQGYFNNTIKKCKETVYLTEFNIGNHQNFLFSKFHLKNLGWLSKLKFKSLRKSDV